MFLSDLSDNVALFARSKKNTEWLRKNDPAAYNAMMQSRKFLSDKIQTYKTKKQRETVFTPRRTRYRQQKDIAFPFSRTENNSFKQWNQELPSRLDRRGKLPELQPSLNSGARLPDLRNAQRGVSPLPTLTTPTRPVLPDLSAITTRWNKPNFDVLASKHDARGIVNPVKDTFTATSGRKPITQTILPKAPKPNTKDTKKLLRNLGVAGVVGGGMLGAYGLKKYNENKKR